LEIRVVLFFMNLRVGYDYETAMGLIKSLCGVFKVNFNFLSTIIHNEHNIRRLSKTNKLDWYQDLVFAGATWGESRWALAGRYLGIDKKSLYRAEYELNIVKYVDEYWVAGLNDRVVVCGVEHMRLEAERFLASIEHFQRIIGNVSLSKTEL